MDLTPQQARVIGCLLEKEITTPDQYPLSLNGLTLACNQKSNRDPVLSLSESEVQAVLDELSQKRLVREVSGFGSRVVKYKHRFCNTEFGELKLNPQALGIIDVLLLRGAQTPGELRSRAARLCRFTDVNQVEAELAELTERGLVQILPREPGKREVRYRHLLGGDAPPPSTPRASSEAVAVDAGLEARVARLEEEVAALKARLDESLEP